MIYLPYLSLLKAPFILIVKDKARTLLPLSTIKKRKNTIVPFKGIKPGFRIRIFFADPDPGKNLHADPDPVPDPWGIRGRGLGVKEKMIFL